VFQLQPETRRVVVVGGDSPADRALLQRIGETTRSVDGVTFDYWTNRPLPEIYQAAATLTPDTIILMGTMQRDVTGRPQNTSRVVQNLAPAASVPVYVLGEGSIGSGPIGGHVVDLEQLGADAARLAARVLAGTPASQLSVEIQSNGVPMADWRALQRWHINPRRLPADCIIRYQPHSVWQDHWIAVTCAVTGLLAQAVTIVALLLQRRQHRLAEAEILRQRTELAHVGRVSMMGQLASALTHELNQPLAAILRNAEAAEIYLQRNPPEMKEIQAILTDIRRDDKRAGNVIDRMRSLFKRQSLTLETLDLKALTEDTLAMIRPDAAARHIKLRAKVSTALPPAQGDRVQVQQVLLNLILNGMDAMTAMPQERRSLTIRLSATKNGNLRVSVTDGGTGIAPENAAHVFEPFFTTKANGMGMGLAISKTIIEAHGGEVWVRSSAMEGTTFTFLLPPAGCDKLKPGDLPSTS
jgi:signal transduction histidine kinase